MLEELDLSKNNLNNIPDFIGNLNNLEVLILNENKLRNLPETIKNLAKLKRLEITNNKLTEEEKQKIKELLPESCKISF